MAALEIIHGRAGPVASTVHGNGGTYGEQVKDDTAIAKETEEKGGRIVSCPEKTTGR
jgi:hypothetical protein